MNDNTEDLRSELKGLSAEQLHDLRDTIEEELECLEQYSEYWNEFNAKYKASIDSLDMLSKINANENSTMIKLGHHVFTPGRLIKSNKVLVYLGDGYYAKMSLEDAKTFFQRKTEDLLKDMKEYEDGNSNKQYIFMLLQETLDSKIREQVDTLFDGSQSQLLSSPNHDSASPE
ncbi:prefoldin subunit 5 [Halyomorpha halys]|uniref:prefoldin subunit 5 n=1 Tax=Halyomorpha halys TaxID=286706 RepID=UPI0006D5040D|nr:prefoldin subunit 5 [Halyomorpha halys]